MTRNCKKIGCDLKGFWTEAAPTGERLVHSKVKHNGEMHTIEIELAQMTVQLIRQDPSFARYFYSLIQG